MQASQGHWQQVWPCHWQPACQPACQLGGEPAAGFAASGGLSRWRVHRHSWVFATGVLPDTSTMFLPDIFKICPIRCPDARSPPSPISKPARPPASLPASQPASQPARQQLRKPAWPQARRHQQRQLPLEWPPQQPHWQCRNLAQSLPP